VLLRGTVGPSLVRNQQPSGPHAGTLFLGWLKSSSAHVLFGFMSVFEELSVTVRSSSCFDSQYVELTVLRSDCGLSS
jgi:hypothetical protein